MKTKEHVEIKEHGNTYEDITFCPECGCRKNTIVKRDTYVDDKSFLLIFKRYGDGNTYRCNECGCKYVVCNLDKVELRKAKGFASVLCVCFACILAVFACIILLFGIPGDIILSNGVSEVFKHAVLCILSTISSAFFFYICE